MSNISSKGRINLTGFILIGVIFLILIGTVLSGHFFKREEKLKVTLENGQNVSFLVCGYNKDRLIRGAMVVVFNSKTNQMATVAILPKTFLSYSRMENSTLEEALQKKVSPDNLRDTIGRLIGQKIDYHFFIEQKNFIRLVDIIGGVEIYSEGIRDVPKNVYIPAGVTLLDGDKSVEFLTYLSGSETDAQYEQFKRLNDFMKNFVKLKVDFSETFTDRVASTILYKTVTTNMSLVDFMIFFTEIRARFTTMGVDYSRGMNNLILYCDKKSMPGYDYILQPKDSSSWIKKELADALENIKNQSVQTEANSIVIEILNGTDIVGFAVRTKRYLSTYGFDILEIGNVPRSPNDPNDGELQKTVVIWRTQEQKGIKLADLINCKKIEKGQPYPNKKIDVTLKLGKDFNGKIVR